MSLSGLSASRAARNNTHADVGSKDAMALSAELGALRRRMNCALAPGAFARLEAEAAIVRASQNLKAARQAGDMAPDFTLDDTSGDQTSLSRLIACGPVVVTFYRGDWCQFCRLFLEALSAVHDQVIALGGRLVALSPQPLACRDATLLFPFPVLVDTGAQVARGYGLDFAPNPVLRPIYAALGQHADCQTILPVPATYIVDRSGCIVLSYVDSDFASRLEPSEIVTALQRLQPNIL
jgi:peroxiredoxin